MRRLLLVVGLVASAAALFLTVVLFVLRGETVVEVFPLDPEVLELPLPTEEASAADIAEITPTATPPYIAPSKPAVVTLQQGLDGYKGCTDTYIYYYLPDSNFCDNPSLLLVAANRGAILIRFDLTKLPDSVVGLNSDSHIHEATLYLYAVQGQANTVIGVYQPRRAWDACTVTWNTPWQGPGADGALDRDAEPRVEAKEKEIPGFLEINLIGIIQEWLRDPEHNYGLILKCFDQRVPSHHVFMSSEAAVRPKLVIKYDPALPTPTPTQTLTPTPTKTPTSTPMPTTTPIGTATHTPIPLPTLSPRVVEVHWRERMDVSKPYSITVTFRPATTSAAISPAHLYVLSVNAQLTAPTFEVVSDSPQEQVLEDLTGSLSWSWQVTPRIVGLQPLSIDLLFAWKQVAGAAPITGKEPGVWYQTKIIRVGKPFIPWSWLEMLRNALIIVSILCLIGWYVLRRRQR
ncbi:MAG: DNRLRE domain-containing protein [Chloroflexi bacterium]|nr:DNRLRE domain-containing protein [Chloroflexota bacterium]